MTAKEELLRIIEGLTAEEINKIYAHLDKLERARDTESGKKTA